MIGAAALVKSNSGGNEEKMRGKDKFFPGGVL
jgi:hypothetical protein